MRGEPLYNFPRNLYKPIFVHIGSHGLLLGLLWGCLGHLGGLWLAFWGILGTRNDTRKCDQLFKKPVNQIVFDLGPILRQNVQTCITNNSDKTDSLFVYMSALEVGAGDESSDYLGVS